MHLAFLGGTRFIGHAAATLAVERGHRVSVLHRGAHPSELAGVRDLIVDRRDPSELCQKLARLAPDVVIDMRAMTRSDAEVTALALAVTGARGVVASSQDVYAQFGRLNGSPAPEPEARVTESSPLGVPFPFRELGGHEGGPDYDKKEVEAVLREAADAGRSIAVLRLPPVYGTRDPRRRFSGLVDRLDTGEREIPCSDGGRFRLTHAHVTDVAWALVLAAETPVEKLAVFNVGERDTPTGRERAERIAREVHSELVWRETDARLPDELAWLDRQPNDFVVSSDALRSALGYSELTTEEQRVRDLVEWCRRSRAGGAKV